MIVYFLISVPALILIKKYLYERFLQKSDYYAIQKSKHQDDFDIIGFEFKLISGDILDGVGYYRREEDSLGGIHNYMRNKLGALE